MGRKTPELSLAAGRAVRKLGSDIRNARRRRRISTIVMAKRAGISRPTLRKVEEGDPAVSLGIYANVLYVLGLEEGLAQLADAANDRLGIELQDEELPERIHT
jgi:transcriptional regulator with XRE-family HTH domain